MKRTCRSHIGRALDIQHLIISAARLTPALDLDVEGEGEEGGEGPRDAEGGASFVHSADHDAVAVVPGAGCAAVAEGPAEVPG